MLQRMGQLVSMIIRKLWDGRLSTPNQGLIKISTITINKHNYIRLESVVYPLFTEPTHMVVFDVAFKRETYFDGSFGVLVRGVNSTEEL